MKQLIEDRMSPVSAPCVSVADRNSVAAKTLRPSFTSQGPKPDQGHVMRQARHSHVFREGDSADRVFEVVEGAVMLYKLLPDGRRQVVELLGPGDVFGLTTLPVHDCSAETLMPAVLTAYDRGAVDQSPRLLSAISQRMRLQICALHEHAVLLGRKSALERVATFLIRCLPNRGGYGCKGFSGPSGQDRAVVSLRMTRQEIADYLGLTIETVSRAFSELRRRRVVSIEKLDEVLVNDVCAMCRLTGAH